MTLALSGKETAGRLEEKFPGAVLESGPESILVGSDWLFDVLAFLKDAEGLDFDYLTHVTAVDYLDYFEVVYQLASLEHNHSLVIKTRLYDRQNPVLPSITSLWRGADFQEREIYDLLGISFSGHPKMERIFLWEGFEGYPLRKDYL